MAGDADPQGVVFDSEASFDRVTAATRFVEGQIRSGSNGWVKPTLGGPANCDVRVTGARDGTTNLYPGQQIIPKPKALPAAKTYLDVGKVWVYGLNDEDLSTDKNYHGVGAFTYPDGVPVVLVTVGGGGGGGDTGIDAYITGGDDASGYSWAEAEQTSGTWGTKSGGRTGSGNLRRMPSNLSQPDMVTGQYVRIWPSVKTPGEYECGAPGSIESFSTAEFMTDVSISATATTVCNADGTLSTTFNFTVTKTRKTLTMQGRDVTGTVT